MLISGAISDIINTPSFYVRLINMWILKEIISSQYNREGSQKCSPRSILYVIQNTNLNTFSLFQIDKFHKNTVSIRCNQRRCRLSLEHKLPVEQYGKYRLFDLVCANVSQSTYDALTNDFFFLNGIFC